MTAEPYPPSHGDDPRNRPDAFDAFEGYLERSELSEGLALGALLDMLHTYHDAAQIMDDKSQEDRDQTLGELAVAMGKGRFVTSRQDPRIASCVFDEMVFWPNARTQTAVTVDRILVRFPKLMGEEYGLPHGPEVTPNDVLVEMYVKGGGIQRYVVNRLEGVVAYPDGEALQFDAEKLRNWRPNHSGDKPDVIHVTTDDLGATDLTAEALSDMLTEESKFREVDEDE